MAGKETIVLVDITQPQCVNTYGVAPCTAALGTSGTRKCYNTRSTCQSIANYNATTGSITTRHSMPNDGLFEFGPVVPDITDVPTVTAAAVNIAGADENAGALGVREKCTVRLTDLQHSDLAYDKYRLERHPLYTVSKGYEFDSWRVGALPSGYFYNADIAGESAFAVRAGPYGGDEVVNVCKSLDTPVGDPGPDGGWGMGNVIPIDKTKGHLFLCWFKRLSTGLSTNGQLYWGMHSDSASDVLQLDGSSNTNPYFYSGGIAIALPTADKWYLVVGYVHANGYGVTDTNLAGVYDPATLARIFAGIEFKWPADVTLCGHRAYHYYNQQISGEIQQMARPVVAPCTEAEAPDLIKRYLLSAGYDPYWRGTHWGKWLARNPYYCSYPSYSMTVYRGYAGNDVSTFDKRTYVLDAVKVDEGGKVQLTGKDIFTKLDDKKAVAPLASPGYLQADITNAQTTAVLAPAGIGNLSYPASGIARIGDECAAFTRVGDNLTLARAQLNTAADQHSHDDTVQLVLSYAAKSAQFIAADLLINHTEIPAASVSLSTWDIAAANAGLVNQYTAFITQPTPVADLLGELAVQAGFTLYPDTKTNTVKFVPLTSSTPPITVTDDWVVGDMKITRDDTKRASQVWVYYGQKDPTRDLEEETNYATRVLSIDLAAEGVDQYGTPAVRKIFSRWIPQFGRANAQNTADRLIAMFRDPPIQAAYEVHKDRSASFTPASIHALQTDQVQDDDGSTITAVHAVVSAAPKENTVEVNTMAVSLVPANSNRDIYIDVDTADVNVRSVYDLLYAPPVGTENVRVFVNAAAYGLNTFGLDTGTFPGGVTITVTVNSTGRVCGLGGKGGDGGSCDQDSATFTAAAGNGQPGGTALKVRQAITLAGSGEINGGGGGAGGGGAELGIGAAGGGGGGSGRGVGTGGNGGNATGAGFVDGGVYSIQPGQPAGSGTLAGPSGGAPGGAGPNPPKTIGGPGGTGGDWATAGANGGTGTNIDAAPNAQAAGTGGAAGKSIDGNAFITYQPGNTLTIRGATI